MAERELVPLGVVGVAGAVRTVDGGTLWSGPCRTEEELMLWFRDTPEEHNGHAAWFLERTDLEQLDAGEPLGIRPPRWYGWPLWTEEQVVSMAWLITNACSMSERGPSPRESRAGGSAG